jgi:hypothetical protein
VQGSAGGASALVHHDDRLARVGIGAAQLDVRLVDAENCVMVTLRDEPGSMPSVLRAVFGVMIFTPHAVNPSV